MSAVLTFVASYWWLWLIITLCSLGLFFHNVAQLPNVREAVKKTIKTVDDMDDADFDRMTLRDQFRLGANQGKNVFKKDVPRSVITDLAYLATAIFGPLLLVAVFLKIVGY